MEKIDVDTLRQWLDDPDVFIMDVRNPGDWDTSPSKIKNAHRFETYNFWDWANDLPRDKRLVLYWAWPQENASSRVGRELDKLSYPKVYVLLGGWKAWEAKGYPTVPKDQDWSQTKQHTALGKIPSAEGCMEISYVDKDTLKAMLGNPDLLIIDIRAPGGWGRSTEKIQGAVRRERDQVAAWGPAIPRDKKIVLYWAWHQERTSARVAQELIAMGFDHVLVLKGGWSGWKRAGYPTEPKA